MEIKAKELAEFIFHNGKYDGTISIDLRKIIHAIQGDPVISSDILEDLLELTESKKNKNPWPFS